MAKMHSKRKGKSGSKKPVVKVVPEWVELSPQDVETLVVKMHKEGMQAAAIGQKLRDQYGVPSVEIVTGKSIKKILKEHGLTPQYPDDLLNLIKKAVNMRKHLKTNKGDVANRVKLTHIESKIKRLVKFYRKRGELPKDWKYEPEQAALLVR
ncbi:MAG: 30S ribosomal protein S15 [Candidatus Micrarchaeia archaeon]